ncbi:XRE family transcriptional regulator [Duganella sp. Root198D2]|nr:XRE family transcriptional regulator [Duganella sp. Root198D2]
MEVELGNHLKRLRIRKNLEQKALAAQAGVSLRSVRNLELGNGSSLRTLVLIVRALGRQSWFDTIAPLATVDPLMLTRQAQPRQRASKPRKKVEKPTLRTNE